MAGATIESFIPVYPDQDDVAASPILSMRQEFLESAAVAHDEPVPKRGKLFAHQKLFAKIARLYHRMLLISEPGTGKTVSFLAATELFRRNSAFRRAYILEKGDILLEEVLRQLNQNIAPPDFEFSDTMRTGTLKRRARAFYTFVTYTKFANMVEKMSDEDVVSTFAGCVFVLDEAHNISYNTESDRYRAIQRVFTLAPRTVQILATATPMVNSRNEILALMNLILPPKKQFPPDYDFDDDDIVKRCQNYVSYVKAELSSARVVLKGVPLSRYGDGRASDTLRVFPSVMGDIQELTYRRFEPQVSLDETNAVYSSSLQASLFVFPDGSIGGSTTGAKVTDVEDVAETELGQTGLSKYIELIPKTKPGSQQWYRFREKVAGMSQFDSKGLGDFLTAPGDTSNLRRLSGKMAAIIDIEIENLQQPGVTFIYSESKQGGGAIMMGMCLEAFGFERFDPTNFDDLKSIPRKARFAVLTPAPETPKEVKEAILKVARSRENVDGGLIKIIIGSRVTRDGTNIYHGVRFHMLQPAWTEAGTFQALMRVLRSDSHVVLRELLGKEVDVEIYRHTAIGRTQNRRTSVVVGDDRSVASIDAYVQTVSAQKDQPIRRVMRALKIAAIDCSLNRERNVTYPVSTGAIVPGTQACDYLDTCEWACGGRVSEKNFFLRLGRYATYDAVPEAETVERERVAIVRQIERRGSASFRLSTTEGGETPELFRVASERVATAVEPLRNRLRQRVYAVFVPTPTHHMLHTTTDLDEVAMVLSCSPLAQATEAFTRYTVKNYVKFDRPFVMAVEIVNRRYLDRMLAASQSADIQKWAKMSGSSLILAKAFEYGLTQSLLRRKGKKVDEKLLDDIRTAIGGEFENRFVQTTVGRIKTALSTATGGKVSADAAFVGLDDDDLVYINTFLSEEDRKIAGEYSTTSRGAGTAAAVAAAQHNELRDPLTKLLRIHIPAESPDLEWRPIMNNGEAIAIEAKLGEKSVSVQMEATTTDAPFVGIYRARDETLMILDKSSRSGAWGRTCKTFTGIELVRYIYRLADAYDFVDAVTIRNVLESLGTLAPKKIDDKIKQTAVPDANAHVYAKTLFDDERADRIFDSDERCQQAAQIGKLPKTVLCEYLKQQLLRLDLLTVT